MLRRKQAFCPPTGKRDKETGLSHSISPLVYPRGAPCSLYVVPLSSHSLKQYFSIANHKWPISRSLSSWVNTLIPKSRAKRTEKEFPTRAWKAALLTSYPGASLAYKVWEPLRSRFNKENTLSRAPSVKFTGTRGSHWLTFLVLTAPPPSFPYWHNRRNSAPTHLK